MMRIIVGLEEGIPVICLGNQRGILYITCLIQCCSVQKKKHNVVGMVNGVIELAACLFSVNVVCVYC